MSRKFCNSSKLLLRFRDLSVGLGETVNKHNEIIEEKGFAYWGWWNKGIERLPESFFQKEKLDDHIYFFDTGSDSFFQAPFYGIEVQNKNKFPSPDEEHTPGYYADSTYLAWFKIGFIKKISAEEIVKKKSYCGFLEAINEDHHSDYEVYSNKQVLSAKELRQQDRTVWLLREYRDGDSLAEVRVQDYSEEAFSTRYIQSDATRILWLSDLHFEEMRKHHLYPKESSAQSSNLLDRISSVVEQAGDIAGIIVSGDITWKASNIEFQEAKDFFRGVESVSSLRREQLGIAPGNHDISFAYGEPYDQEREADKALEVNKEEYKKFFKDMVGVDANEHLSMGRKFLLGGAQVIDIAFLNSSLLEQYQGTFQGYGYVGGQQLKQVEKDMGWSTSIEKPKLAKRIVVLHHHLLPVSYMPAKIKKGEGAYFPLTIDASEVIEWLIEHEVDLVLHGHMHESFTATIQEYQGKKANYPLKIIGLGSSGVSLEDIPANEGLNSAAILDFSNGEASMTRYSYSPNKAIMNKKEEKLFD